ncbi:MAG: hypothetical protein J2P25_16615 [Nocardiopsaceae bacterium]|nr:hypothetical protein [Nocardiopsaceae bacterium]
MDSEMDMETPEEDAAEQARDADGGKTDEEDPGERPGELPIEADEADAAEQVRDIGYDDDDYR